MYFESKTELKYDRFVCHVDGGHRLIGVVERGVTIVGRVAGRAVLTQCCPSIS